MRYPKISIAILLTVLFAYSSSAAQSTPRLFSELHVMRSLRQLHSAQETYRATVGSGNYGSLAQLRSSGFIDEALASGSKYGFVYTVSTNTSTFTVNATPRVYRKTGVRSFFIDRFGEIRGGD